MNTYYLRVKVEPNLHTPIIRDSEVLYEIKLAAKNPTEADKEVQKLLRKNSLYSVHGDINYRLQSLRLIRRSSNNPCAFTEFLISKAEMTSKMRDEDRRLVIEEEKRSDLEKFQKLLDKYSSDTDFTNLLK